MLKDTVAMQERRQSPRIGLSFPVECKRLRRRDYFYTVSRDLSAEGLKIISENFLSPGTVIKVNINLIDKVVNSKVKVAWCSKERYADRYAAGLEFVEIAENEKGYISSFLTDIYPS